MEVVNDQLSGLSPLLRLPETTFQLLENPARHRYALLLQSKFRDFLDDKIDEVKSLALRWVQADLREEAEVAVISFG